MDQTQVSTTSHFASHVFFLRCHVHEKQGEKENKIFQSDISFFCNFTRCLATPNIDASSFNFRCSGEVLIKELRATRLRKFVGDTTVFVSNLLSYVSLLSFNGAACVHLNRSRCPGTWNFICRNRWTPASLRIKSSGFLKKWPTSSHRQHDVNGFRNHKKRRSQRFQLCSSWGSIVDRCLQLNICGLTCRFICSSLLYSIH